MSETASWFTLQRLLFCASLRAGTDGFLALRRRCAPCYQAQLRYELSIKPPVITTASSPASGFEELQSDVCRHFEVRRRRLTSSTAASANGARWAG
jgi:hypothetical protein